MWGIAEEVRDVLEARRSKYWPFKYRKVRGPGPRGRRDRRQDKYVCRRRGRYVQMCRIVKGPRRGRRKLIRINRAYKTRYNKIYRKWRVRRKQKYKAAAKKAAATRKIARVGIGKRKVA